MMVLLIVLAPLLMAAMVAALPERRAKSVALVGALIQSLAILAMGIIFPWSQGQVDHFMVVREGADPSWIATLGINLSVGVDTVSMLLLLLTGLLGPICVLASFTAISERVRTYYSWLLILQAAMAGVFVARDMILFYVFFEFTLIPLFILINMYGSTNRKAAATKFFLYTFTGSLLTLAGVVYIAWVHASGPTGGYWTFDFQTLAQTARSMTFSQQAWVFWAMLAGFAVKVPLFPVHTWLPLAHTEAPTAGSVILAGVLLKLGTYGMFKFAIQMVPAAAIFYAPTMAILAIIGIVYAGLICWVQTDVKKLVAYSSVSHLGYCVLGLFALNSIGITGSVLYMINHGLSTGALFLLIGMMYERYHTRSLKEVGGLASKMPIWSTFMVFFAMASVGLPGLNGFISEMMCILGAFQASGFSGHQMPGQTWAQFGLPADALPVGATPGKLGPWFALAAGAGIIITAMYILFMLGKICFGPLKEPAGHDSHGGGHGHGSGHGDASESGHLPTDLTAREVGVLVPLAVLCLVLGLHPKPVLKALEKPVNQVVRVIDAARANPPMDAPTCTFCQPSRMRVDAAGVEGRR
jgi:NADH-quinone oxidoreductase subunit M